MGCGHVRDCDFCQSGDHSEGGLWLCHVTVAMYVTVTFVRAVTIAMTIVVPVPEPVPVPVPIAMPIIVRCLQFAVVA